MPEEKKRFVLRMDPEALKVIEQWATDEFRSTNSQIEFLLHKAIRESKRGPNDAPSKAQKKK